MVPQTIKDFYTLAKGKVTTYLALGVAGTSQLADHAENLVNMAPQLKPYLPTGPHFQQGLHYTLTGLGFMIVWSRIRRELGSKGG
jgi:hypothetical protein